MFSFIKNSLQKIYSAITSKAHALFSRTHVDEQTLAELELLLINADTGVKTTHKLIEQLKKQTMAGTITTGQQLREALQEQLIQVLSSTKTPAGENSVYLLVGINGSGKTTACSKLAKLHQANNKKVLLVAADTFRAAATEQLTAWANTLDVPIVTGSPDQDPASVVFKGCEQFKNEKFDVLIIDTAGRLQTKTNLMKELEKIKRIITRQLPEHTLCTLLTIDAMLGQNSFEQATLFNESTQLDGIILTKMDGTGKGGIVFSISQELSIPIAYITFGEQLDHIQSFNAHDYVRDLFS
ncbi:signal recognition particle-docking protein FtsY [Candidatus Dependentiae bacterium HGW-Dependentiae-1]|nr:MAG: signal recognition particle-docking protein FtsY [Candidatus Dependentiae bacterium HGW-Dependentiae-1]